MAEFLSSWGRLPRTCLGLALCLAPPSQAPDAWAAGGWVGGGLCVRSGSGRGACHAFAQVSVEWCRCGFKFDWVSDGRWWWWLVGGGGGHLLGEIRLAVN